MSSDAARISQLELRAKSIQEDVQKEREERLQIKASASAASAGGSTGVEGGGGGGGGTASNNNNESGHQQSPKSTTLEKYDGCGGGCGECCVGIQLCCENSIKEKYLDEVVPRA